LLNIVFWTTEVLTAAKHSCIASHFFVCLPPLVTFKTPAPGAYSPEKVHPQGERHAPVYSMGNRTRYRKRKKAVNSFFLNLILENELHSTGKIMHIRRK